MNRRIFNRYGKFPSERWPVLGWRIVELHSPDCSCSYEEFATRRFGFKVPQSKAFNAWWIAYLRTSKGTYYARTTLPWLPRTVSRPA